MKLFIGRRIALSLLCLAIVGYVLTRSQWKVVSPNGAESREPGDIASRLPEASRLEPLARGRSNHAFHRVDPSVRPASGVLPLVATMALQAEANGGAKFAIRDVEQGGYLWPQGGALTQILLLSDQSATIHGTGDAAKLKVEGGSTATGESGTWSVEVPRPSETVKVIVTHDTEGFATLMLRRPGAEPRERPNVTAVSTNTFAAPEQVTQATNVYDQYLRLKGQSVQRGTKLQFHVFRIKADAKKEFAGLAHPNQPVKIEDNGTWDAEVVLPEVPQVGSKYQIVVLATTSNDEHYSVAQGLDSDPLRLLTVTAVDMDLLRTPPDLKVQVADNDSTGVQPGQVALVGRRTFTIAGTIPVDSSKDIAKDVRIAIFRRGEDQPLSVSKLNASTGAWSADVTVLEDGVYQIEGAVVLGSTIGKRSASVEVHVGTRGPRVVSVEPTNLAFSPDRRTIKVTFDPRVQIDEASLTAPPKSPPTNGGVAAEKPANQSSPGLPFVMTPSRGLPLQLPSPAYNANENSVTFSFGQDIPPEIYTFAVKKSVTDKFGHPMDADYLTQLIMPVGADAPAIGRGITGPSGPYVEFSEYTNPRPFINGFNPSDHVETRVSRLYYFRDAHRVAQLVNREAKSYNRAAVDMQQQLADKAHQIADQATDTRRAKERKASEAAKKTREAERDLKEAEARSVSAANQAAGAAADLQVSDATARDTTLPDDRRANAQGKADSLRNVVSRLEDVAAVERQKAAAARDRVQQLRETESQATEGWQGSVAVEDRAREEQFRREVAAAHADPDTYAPGMPDSKDPVRQVSVSVIGEGLVQLRGPLKGINNIRTMINQIDAPVGQVRVSVHSVQINGEKGDRMEKVAAKIQRYIDHSRFLTLQSGEMLRKAIVQVAAEKAMQLGDMSGIAQEDRDRKYLYSFFGEDFIRELEAMDSEFLKTGNKLLSLHSMDSTSLASAMFIMGLAKNTTRMQILEVFEGMMAGELPMAEQNYFEAGLTCDGKHKLFSKDCKREDFQLLSQNAKFQSIRGMFNAEIAGDDIMTPIQREFVRLAQIFKSRLIVEMELKQRIMERSVIEDRLGDRLAELKEAKKKEDQANALLAQAEKSVGAAQSRLVETVREVQSQVDVAKDEARDTKATADRASASTKDLLTSFEASVFASPMFGGVKGVDRSAFEKRLLEIAGKVRATDTERSDSLERYVKDELKRLYAQGWKNLLAPLPDKDELGARFRQYRNDFIEFQKGFLKILGREMADDAQQTLAFTLTVNDRKIPVRLPEKGTVLVFVNPDEDKEFIRGDLLKLISQAERTRKFVDRYRYSGSQLEAKKRADRSLNRILKDDVSTATDDQLLNDLHRTMTVFEGYGQLVQGILDTIEKGASGIQGAMVDLAKFADVRGNGAKDLSAAYNHWRASERDLSQQSVDVGPELGMHFASVRKTFGDLIAQNLEYEQARKTAESSRRGLDHKKFLDMLVDEMEDKFIELLEGTRAHTANIDAYIKRLMTSLDDDFNTQFYYPTFRKVREASQLWDVQMGQVETTNVLANNRGFAKVSPEATMEFDLPKRDILINEAMNGAKAMINDFGALAQDPTFLAMAKMGSGSPTSTQGGGAAGGLSTVRNVLPGLSTDTAESVLGQQGPGGAKLGSAMESLIPDPAIYKFETGTGWEMRPVIQPDGQALVFHFTYLYTTNIREPVRADEKHLGRVKRHFVDTDVQLSNFELREISRYTVALKASRTAHGVPLFEDVPVVGVLFRPQPSAESSLQQNIILGQSTIFPTLFDLMGLRWAPVVADLDPLRLSNDEFIVRNRRRVLMNRVFDQSSSSVDEFLRIPQPERRMDLYRSQETIPSQHPNGYDGPGVNLQDSQLQEGYSPTRQRPSTPFVPAERRDGSPLRQQRPIDLDRLRPGEPGAGQLPVRGAAEAHDGVLPARIYTPGPEPVVAPESRWDRPAPRSVFPPRDTGVAPAQFEQEVWPNSERTAFGPPRATIESAPRDTSSAVMKRLPAVTR